MSIQKINRKSKPFLVRCRDSAGKVISATFATRSEAQEFELSHKAEKQMPTVLQIDAVERADVARIKKLCAENGVTLNEAIAMFQRAIGEAKIPRLQLDEAQTKFHRYLVAKKVRPRTFGFYQQHTNRLLKWAELRSLNFVDEISPAIAQQYIDSVLSKPQAKRALRAFFNFLRDAGYLTANAFQTAKLPRILGDKAPIRIMSVQDTRKNLDAIRPEFRPLYALMAFAGIRPEEIIFDERELNAKRDRLSVSDIDFERKRITVRAAVAKTRQGRIITGLTNLWAWLEPIKKWKAIYPPVMKMQRSVGCRTTTDNVYQQWLKAKRALPCKVPQDALRHSFASYAYHVFGVEKAVEILGHDYNVYKKFYKSIATEADSIAYFNILPAAGRSGGNKK